MLKMFRTQDLDLSNMDIHQDWSSLPAEPLVSICCTAYNQEAFISDAIEGFLMQKTDFPFEILIHDDASADGTAEIIKKYQEDHPELIRAIYQEKNQYSQGVYPEFIVTELARGKYIAWCEGDDYWIDPYKLQKQADFLETHPEYVMISNNALNIREEEEYKIAHLIKRESKPYDFTTRDLMIKNRCITLTVMYRNGLVKEYPPIFFESTGTDRRFYILLTLHGKGYVSPDVVGVYRTHKNSLTGAKASPEGKIAAMEEAIRNARNWNEYFNHEYDPEEEYVCSHTAQNLAVLAFKQKKVLKAFQYIMLITPDRLKTQKAKLIARVFKSIGKILNIQPATI
jgi:glycosyltransferase involved in cell wall biosynthesis